MIKDKNTRIESMEAEIENLLAQVKALQEDNENLNSALEVMEEFNEEELESMEKLSRALKICEDIKDKLTDPR